MMESTFIEGLLQLGAIGGVAAICLKTVLDDKKDDKLLFRETVQVLTKEMKEDRELYRESLKQIMTNLNDISDSSQITNTNLQNLVKKSSEQTLLIKKMGG